MKKLIYILFPILLGLLWYNYSFVNIKDLTNDLKIEYIDLDLPPILKEVDNPPYKSIYLADSSIHNPFTNIKSDSFMLKLSNRLGFPSQTEFEFEFEVLVKAKKIITEEGRQYIYLSLLDDKGRDVTSLEYVFVATEEEHSYSGTMTWNIEVINQITHSTLLIDRKESLYQQNANLLLETIAANPNGGYSFLEYNVTYQTNTFKHTLIPKFDAETEQLFSEDKNLLYTYLKDSIPSNQKEVLSKNIRDVKINYFRSAEDTEAIALERAKYLGSVLMGECLNYSGGAKVDKKYMPDIIGNFAYPTEVFVDSLLEKGVLKVEFGMQKK